MTDRRRHPFPRRLLLPFALALAACLPAAAQDARLPDICSSAGTVLSPARQAEYGAMTLAQLRHAGYVLDDAVGLVVYEVKGDGSLEGAWTISGKDGSGTEKLTPQ